MALKKLMAVSMFPTLALQSWQEPLTLTAPDSTTYTVLSSTTALNLGSNFRMPVGRNWQLDVNGGVLFGTTSAQNQGGASAAPISYSARSISTLGAQASPGFFFRPESRSVAIGLSFPVTFRSVTYPDPGEGYSITPGGKVRAGAMLDMQFESGAFVFSPKAGILGDLKRMIGMIQLGYRP